MLKSGLTLFLPFSFIYNALDWLVQQELTNGDDNKSNVTNWTDRRKPSSIVTPSMVERYILVVMYYSMGGDGWNGNDNWLSRLPVCLWEGVQCTINNVIVNSTSTFEEEGSQKHQLFLKGQT